MIDLRLSYDKPKVRLMRKKSRWIERKAKIVTKNVYRQNANKELTWINRSEVGW